MPRISRFADHAHGDCPRHGELALALAAEFGAVCRLPVRRELDRLAAGLAGARRLRPLGQLGSVGRRLADAGFRPSRRPDIGPLLLDRALVAREAHPSLLAVIAVEAAARAGLELGVVANHERHYVAHPSLAAPLLMDPAGGHLVDARQLPGVLTWRCAHELAFALLTAIVERSRRVDDLTSALRAARLRLELPLDDHTLGTLHRELAGLQARLN
jgi:hypothetical protein